VLFLILYLLHRRKAKEGVPFFCFFIGYGLFRFLIEFVRQPDAHLGFLWGGATMGQLLSLPMILFGLCGLIYIYRFRATR
jgi:phosphatidylglycerol:prolipoprotein diacylglycerol transferase